jgi:predicted nucleic acid-binding protein
MSAYRSWTDARYLPRGKNGRGMTYMMSKKIFFDTNILVHALDKGDVKKQKKARQLLREAGESSCGVLSTQVLQEFYVVTTKKIGIEPLAAKEMIRHFQNFETVVITPQLIADAIDCSVLNRISFWDSLIIVAAESARCAVLWSEDLSDGQTIHGVRIKNPFIKAD